MSTVAEHLFVLVQRYVGTDLLKTKSFDCPKACLDFL